MSDTDGPGLPGAATDAQGDYEPPRLDELGTIKELTLGFFIPATPDNSIAFGSV